MISSQSKGQFTLLRVFTNNLGDRFAYARNKPRVFEFSDGGIVGGGDLFELVMSVEVDVPVKLFELIDEACFD